MAKRSNHLKVVQQADVSVVIANMEQSFKECRDWGHSWRAYDASIDRRSMLIEEILRCSRCFSRRYRTISGRSGDILKRRYVYREGYLIPAWGRMSKDDKGELRLAIIRQMLLTHGQNIEVDDSA
jgi:hypothetical protein